MKATILDKRFDAGEDVSDQIDWSRSKRPNPELKRVNVDFPAWVVKGLINTPSAWGLRGNR